MLPVLHRLRASRDFEQVYRQGKRYGGSLLNVFVLGCEPGPTRIGITASRKVGNAVRRNRLKRLVRESLRPLVLKLTDGFKIVVVVRPRPGSENPSLLQMGEEISSLLMRSGLLGKATPISSEVSDGSSGRGAV
ncbi:MAG: ribonuclease P protein component [Gemmatimonadaceae bacterium]|nr:ribonuclease P protein component [Gloeobacterales cyanobacterium ES-bin-141]